MKVLVTGGAGSVGSVLVKALLAGGNEVRVLDKNPGKLLEQQEPRLEVITGGIEDEATAAQAVAGVEAIYQLAESFLSRPPEVFQIDVKGNINLLEAACTAGVRHFVFTSTTRVYGKPQRLPIDEEHPREPENSGRPLYAISKLTNEKLCLLYQRERGLPTTTVRFWWAFGPDIGGRAMRTLVDTALKGETLQVPEKAGGSFIHNDDIAAALQVMTFNDRAYGQAFNLTSGRYVSWEELARMVVEISGSASKVETFSPEAKADSAFLRTDPDIPGVWEVSHAKATEVLGYQPKYSPAEMEGLLRAALKDLVEARRQVLAQA